MARNIFGKTLTDINDGETHFVGFTRQELFEIDQKSGNFLVIWNTSDQDMIIRLNKTDDERYPLFKTSGRVVINPDDEIKFTSIEVINNSGANSTGDVNFTYGLTKGRFSNIVQQ